MHVMLQLELLNWQDVFTLHLFTLSFSPFFLHFLHLFVQKLQFSSVKSVTKKNYQDGL